MENFWVNVTCFVLPFSPFFLTASCSFWYGLKDLFTLPKVVGKVVLGISTDDITSGRRELDVQGQLWAVQGQMG